MGSLGSLGPVCSAIVDRIYVNPEAGALCWIHPRFNINSFGDLLLKIAIFFGLLTMKLLLYILELLVPQKRRQRQDKDSKVRDKEVRESLPPSASLLLGFQSLSAGWSRLALLLLC